MKSIKKNWKTILIVILTILFLNKCTVSCNRGNENIKQAQVIKQKDSIIDIQSDSITALNNTIKLYNEKVNGLENATAIKDQAIKDIKDAKKNINVSFSHK